MSNPEIEDVLSSIRRLVSEDLRPGGRGVGPVATPEPVDKLLLTPALRIADPVPGDGATPVRSEALVLDKRVVAPVEDVVSRFGASVAEEDWEAPFGDPEVWPGTLPPPGTKPPRRPSPDQAGVFVHRPASVLRLGPAEALLAKSGPAGGDAAEVAEQHAGLSWVEVAEAGVMAELSQGVEDDLLSRRPKDDPAGTMVDTAELRGLVRDLIRQELAGDLGERITHTVRKLVRAEIARVMTLRDLE